MTTTVMTYWVYIWVWAQVEPAHAVIGVQPVRAALEHEPVAAELTLHAVEQEQRIDLLARQRRRHVHHVDPTCNQWIYLFDTYFKVITCNLWRFWTLFLNSIFLTEISLNQVLNILVFLLLDYYYPLSRVLSF